jgi:hypothetical protein
VSWDSDFGNDAFGADDDTSPVIENISPAPGTPIPSDQIVTLETVDEIRITNTSLVVTMNGSPETAWDGFVFCGPYRSGSSVNSSESESGGHRLSFTLRRLGGWPFSPTFTAEAIDSGENEAS